MLRIHSKPYWPAHAPRRPTWMYFLPSTWPSFIAGETGPMGDEVHAALAGVEVAVELHDADAAPAVDVGEAGDVGIFQPVIAAATRSRTWWRVRSVLMLLMAISP